MSGFNIHSTTQEEIDDFIGSSVTIAQSAGQNNGLNAISDAGVYEFNQNETLNLIDFYSNSKFESGNLDVDGTEKLFLNVSSFRADVASKQVDLDTKNFTFVPEEGHGVWGAYMANKEFTQWAKDNYFGELTNDVVEQYPKYGTVVLKKVGKELAIVPLKTLRNQQDAEDLKTARFVIEEHADMTLSEMEEMPDWDTSEVAIEKHDDTLTVYERYGRVPLKWYNEMKNLPSENIEDWESIDVMCALTIEKPENDDGEETGAVLFLEAVDERPYEEVHWKRQQGRWLGIGEIETQFENQVARNMFANFRRKLGIWSSRKIFQTADTEVAKNLITQVQDGDVLQVSPNGQISPVDMSSRNIAEIQSAEASWEENSNQKSFTFEVATGEALPSGTPFRLGVVLSNAVNSHFNLKREKLGLFFTRVVFNFVLPIFENDTSKEHTISLFADEEGVGALREAFITQQVNQKIKDEVLDNGRLPNVELLRADIEERVRGGKFTFVKIKKAFYKDIKYKVIFDPTGESVDLPQKIETLTTLYQSMQQTQDPRAESVLAKLLALTGENIEALAQGAPQQDPNQPVGQQVQNAFKSAGNETQKIADASGQNL